jgi:subfamily B ATP-binding cassette protein MsbA
MLLKLSRRYWLHLFLVVVLLVLVSSTMGFSFLSAIPFVSKILQGDPVVFKLSVKLPENIQNWLDVFAERINETPNVKLLFYLIYFIVVTTILRGILLYLAEVELQFVGNSIVRRVRSRIYAHLQSLSLDYFTEQRTGELMSRITHDAELLHQGVTEGFTTLMRHLCDLMMFIALPVIIYWKLALMVFGLFVLLMPPIIIIGNFIRRLSSHSQQKIADISSMLQETLSGVRVVKAFSMEDYERRRFDNENSRFYRIRMSMARRDALVSPVTEFVVVVAISLVAIFMGKAILNREIDMAQFFIYIACLGSIPRPIKQIGRANNKIQRSAAAAERMDLILKMESSIKEQPGAVELSPIRQEVKFDCVTFAYNSKDPILKDINLIVPRGEILAIVGASGVGKSSLVNLIPRFYDPTEGRIEIDGRDIRTVTLKSLRGQIGIVTQEVILFNDTVAGNIAYGNKDTTRERIITAAKIANAHEFVLNLPHGYDTVIGERGYMLSGGERQRISIARAILKDPPIMILDEATSALDTESERLVQEAINRLMVDRTVFVIAHRLSTIRNADRIIVLDDKQIVQMGKHEELVTVPGAYKRLYEMQFNIELSGGEYI